MPNSYVVNYVSDKATKACSDFLADSDNKGATRQKAMDEWEKLKKMPVQKNYQEYKKFRNKIV